MLSVLQCNEILFYNQHWLSARTAGHSLAPLSAGAPIRNATKIRLARGSQSLTSWGKFWRILCSSQLYFVQPSATLIKVDFSLNLFFLSLRCFITEIFLARNIFVPFFICRPAQVLYSQSACQKISPKLDCIKSRSLYCSVLAKIISDQQKPEREKLKSPKIETHFLRSSAQ